MEAPHRLQKRPSRAPGLKHALPSLVPQSRHMGAHNVIPLGCRRPPIVREVVQGRMLSHNPPGEVIIQVHDGLPRAIHPKLPFYQNEARTCQERRLH